MFDSIIYNNEVFEILFSERIKAIKLRGPSRIHTIYLFFIFEIIIIFPTLK